LPKGCKDLIDVLRPPRPQRTVNEPVGRWEIAPKPDRIEARGLDHIEHYVSRLLQSTATFRSLLISSLDRQTGVGLFYHDGVLVVTTFIDCSDSVREGMVRGLFVEADIKPTMDYLMIGSGEVPTRVIGYPLPAAAPRAAQLAAELMRRAYGLTDEAGLDFLYDEGDAS
jgi:hypothetical protein